MTHTLSVEFFRLNDNNASGTRDRFRLTDNEAGSTRVRTFLALRLILFAALLPILLSLVSDSSPHPLITPVLAYFYLIVFLVLMIPIVPLLIMWAMIMTYCLPFLIPVFSSVYYIISLAIGLLLEATIIAPRMLLGSVLDLILCHKGQRYPPRLFSPGVNLLLLALLPATAMASSYAWHASYHPRVVAALQHNVTELTDSQRMIAGIWNESRAEALVAQSMDEAYGSLAQLKALVPELDFYDEVKRRRLYDTVTSAELHLQHCNDYGRTAYKEWEPEYWAAVNRLDLVHVSQ